VCADIGASNCSPRAPAWESPAAEFRLAMSLPCLCAFLKDSVDPDLRRHVIDAQVVGPLGDLPVERIGGLELKVQKPARVTLVSSVTRAATLEPSLTAFRQNQDQSVPTTPDSAGPSQMSPDTRVL
jgi:hypothetical protein